MNIRGKLIWVLFLPKKLILKIVYKGKLSFGGKNKIEVSAILRAQERTSRIRIGHGTGIRGNTEIHAHGGVVSIGNSVFINRNCMIVSHEKIDIQDNAAIGPNCLIYDHDHDLKGGMNTAAIVIKRNAWIAANVVILKGVTIGENAVVAAGSVVTKDVPDGAVLIQKRETSYVDIP